MQALISIEIINEIYQLLNDPKNGAQRIKPSLFRSPRWNNQIRQIKNSMKILDKEIKEIKRTRMDRLHSQIVNRLTNIIERLRWIQNKHSERSLPEGCNEAINLYHESILEALKESLEKTNFLEHEKSIMVKRILELKMKENSFIEKIELAQKNHIKSLTAIAQRHELARSVLSKAIEDQKYDLLSNVLEFLSADVNTGFPETQKLRHK